jgi:hypothetical protein
MADDSSQPISDEEAGRIRTTLDDGARAKIKR